MPAWWSEDRINATVTRDFIWRQLGSRKYQDQLDRPLAFGNGLTNDTYFDWIILKGRRIFLVLDDIGLPECVFKALDRSLDDEDLPLSSDVLHELSLFDSKSDTLERKFYKHQFKYLIKDLASGRHIDYGAHDVVPLEPLNKRPSVASSNAADRVIFQDHVYARKRISTTGCDGVDRVHFLMHMKGLQALKHAHLVTVFASYTQKEFSYILMTPSHELTLKTFLEEQPKTFKQMDKEARRETLLKWTHCLSSALAYLHSRDFTHQGIRPSSISISSQNTVCLTDFWALDNIDRPDPYKAEIYDHAAPEKWQLKACLHETAALKIILPGGGRTVRRLPSMSATSPTSRSGSISTYVNSHARTHSTTESSSSSSHSHSRNALITTFAHPPMTGGLSFAADVFSLTTILLDLVTLILDHSIKAFTSHRSKHNRQAGRGGAPADASFHKNLLQVGTWMEMLQSQAKEKERALRKAKLNRKAESLFYGAIVGVIGVCKHGLSKEPSHRFTARELEKETRQWVDRGLGTGRRWCCGAEAEEVIPGLKLASVTDADQQDAKSESSFDMQLPIERPMSLMERTSTEREEAAMIGAIQAQQLHSLEPEEDWPLRSESKISAEGYKPNFHLKTPRRPPRPAGAPTSFYEGL